MTFSILTYLGILFLFFLFVLFCFIMRAFDTTIFILEHRVSHKKILVSALKPEKNNF